MGSYAFCDGQREDYSIVHNGHEVYFYDEVIHQKDHRTVR